LLSGTVPGEAIRTAPPVYRPQTAAMQPLQVQRMPSQLGMAPGGAIRTAPPVYRPQGAAMHASEVQRMPLLLGAALGVGAAYLAYKAYTYFKPPSPGYIIKVGFKPGIQGFSPERIIEYDQTTDRGAEALARKTGINGVTKASHRMMGSWFKLTDIAPDGKLHIIGHGVPAFNDQGRVTHAESMSGYSMPELADMLVNELGLPQDFHGRIVMHTCYSGVGGEESLAVKLQLALRDRNRLVEVKALLGRGIIRDTSSQFQMPERFSDNPVTGQMTVQTVDHDFTWQTTQRHFETIAAASQAWCNGTRDDETNRLGMYARILSNKGFLDPGIGNRMYEKRSTSGYSMSDHIAFSKAARDWMRDSKDQHFKFTAVGSKILLQRPEM
jgi:hypothetical protein